LNADTRLTGTVELLLPGGEAVVRAADRTFLVANAVPGDRVTIEATGKQRGAERARLLAVIEPSAERIEPPCPVAARCGGCALQYLAGESHAEVKSEWVRGAFRNSLSDKTEWIPAVPGALNSRRRLRWYVGHDAAGRFLGFRAANSHDVIRHDSCLCATPLLNALRVEIEATMPLERFESLQALQLHEGIHLILESGGPADDFLPPVEQLDGLPLQWWLRNGNVTRPLTSPAQKFHDAVPGADDNSLTIQIGPDDFIQGQREGNEAMIRQLIEWSSGARFVVDLFAGVGNLSLPVAKAHGARVVGAELNGASVKAANANARRLGLDARYMQANLFEQFNSEPFAGGDLLILDPPRRGAKKVCSMMGQLLPAKIVMVNCDVASGGRDGETLQALGYRLHSLRALDLFPYTGHVEAMSLWLR